jgi:hypothetical protein
VASNGDFRGARVFLPSPFHLAHPDIHVAWIIIIIIIANCLVMDETNPV